MNNIANQQDIERELVQITSQLLLESHETFKREVKLTSSLQRHLGIDSLARAELFQRIEKQFAVTVPDRLLAEAETLQDIVDYLKKATPETKRASFSAKMASHGMRPHINPASAKTLIDVLLLYGDKAPDKTHIYFQQEEGSQEVITYGELLKSSLRLACALRELGLKEGETVAIMQPTQLGFFYTFLGTLLAGGIPVPIYPPFRMHMLEAYAKTEAHILKNAEVRILVTFDEAKNLSHLLKAFIPSLKHVTTVKELMQPKELTKLNNGSADSFAFIQYTSGSTSNPKGVLLTNFNLLTNIRAYGKAIQVGEDDVAVSWLPLYHDMGLIGMWLGSLYFGVPLVLMTPFSFLNHPEKWLWAMHYHRGTISGAPNFAYELCVRKIEPAMIEGLDLSSCRIFANGAEKIYPRTLEQFANKFAPYGLKKSTLLPVYGLAESTVCLTVPPLNRDFRIDYVDREQFEKDRQAVAIGSKTDGLSFVSCGLPIENHEIRITDEQNNVLKERQVGRLQFRGPSIMQGYYNNPEATQAIYHDGWLDSGDLAYIADQELFITGRLKDLIIKAGRNLYPAEIEEIVGAVPGVRQGCVAAFGFIDSDRGTEQLIVVAETREKNKDKQKMISQTIQEHISNALDIVPDHIILVPPHTVLKTSSGKLQRNACKKMFIEGTLQKARLPAWVQMLKLGIAWFLEKSLTAVKKLGKILYSLYVVIIGVIIIVPLYFSLFLSTRDTAARAVRLAARILIKACFLPFDVKGKENLTTSKPVIFAANHCSYLDAVILLALVPPDTRFVGKKEVLSTPILRTFMEKLDYLAVDRLDLSKGLADTKRIEEALRANHSIVIFPEGTFSYSSGLRPFRLGAFKLATETKTAICPIAIKGSRLLLRGDERLLRFTPIHVMVCEPIKPEGTEWEDVTRLRASIRTKIAAYCGEPSLDYIAAQKVSPV